MIRCRLEQSIGHFGRHRKDTTEVLVFVLRIIWFEGRTGKALTTLPHAPQLLGSLRMSWHGAPLQLRVPAAHVGMGAGIAVITGVAPTHEQALE